MKFQRIIGRHFREGNVAHFKVVNDDVFVFFGLEVQLIIVFYHFFELSNEFVFKKFFQFIFSVLFPKI